MAAPQFTTEAGSPDVVEHGGRFFVNMGRPGFNTRANNAQGFATHAKALGVIAAHTTWRCVACGEITSVGDKPVARSRCKC
jgi:hypothetical protein